MFLLSEQFFRSASGKRGTNGDYHPCQQVERQAFSTSRFPGEEIRHSALGCSSGFAVTSVFVDTGDRLMFMFPPSVSSIHREKKTILLKSIPTVKGSMPPCIDHMELLAWMQRADFSEHIQRFKLHGNPLNSPHFDAPNTKFAPTGYRHAPNIISHHYKQQLSAKASIIP